MKRHLLAALAVAVLLVATGCKTRLNRDFYAKRILVSDCPPLSRDLADNPKHFLDQGKIDKHLRIDTPEGLPIDLWVIRAKSGAAESAPTVLMLHGLTESKANCLPPGEQVAKKGYNVVLMDLRAHGQSGGEYIGYGVTEARDIKYVMDKLLADGVVAAPIYVFGITHGAVAGIHYAAIEERVNGVLAMAPYKDADSFGRLRLGIDALAIGEAQYQDILARAGVLGGFDPREASTVEAVKKLHCPLLIVHGLLDLGVPVGHGRAVYDAANEPKRFQIVTPGPEQLALFLIWDQWVADQMDKMIRRAPPARPGKPVKKPAPPVKKPAPMTKPAPAKKPAPTTKPAPAKKPAPTTKPAPAKKPTPMTKPAPKKGGSPPAKP